MTTFRWAMIVGERVKVHPPTENEHPPKTETPFSAPINSNISWYSSDMKILKWRYQAFDFIILHPCIFGHATTPRNLYNPYRRESQRRYGMCVCFSYIRATRLEIWHGYVKLQLLVTTSWIFQGRIFFHQKDGTWQVIAGRQEGNVF